MFEYGASGYSGLVVYIIVGSVQLGFLFYTRFLFKSLLAVMFRFNFLWRGLPAGINNPTLPRR